MTEERAIYELAQSKISELSKLVLKDQILLSGAESIKWWDYRNLSDYFQDLITIQEKTSDSSKKVFSGFIRKIDEFYILFVNDSISQEGRKNFTFCHEFYHFLYHFGLGLGNEFNDLISDGNYSEKLDPIELEANYGASLMMCNDEALLYGLAYQWTVNDFCQHMRMTPSAVKFRLVNYLKFNCDIPEERARNLAGAYTKGHNLERRNFLNVLIPNWKFFDEEFRSIRGNRFMSGDAFDEFYAQIGSKTHTASHFYQAQNLFRDKYLESLFVCSKCNSNYSEPYSFCPTCSAHDSLNYSQKNKYQEGSRMIYSKIETNEQGTPLVCPRCEAENLDDNFKYCPYCTTFLHNVCLGKEEDKFVKTINGEVELTIAERYEQNGCSNDNLDGGFRYCPECGCETSYNEQRLLDNWKSEKEKDKDPFSGTEFTELPF